VDVKGVGEGAGAQVVGAADALRAGIPRAVHRTVYPAGLFADVLHDVDFAARGPAGRGDVVAQHPESGPQPLPARYLNPGLDGPVEVVVPHEPPPRGPCRGSGERRARGDGEPEQEAAHGDCFRYLQATIPAPVTFSSNAWLPLASIAGMSCFCVATVSPLAFTNSNVTAVGVLGLVLRFVTKPPSFAPCSSGVNVPTVTSVVMESAVVR